MRFTSFIVAGVLALTASAQATTDSVTTTEASSTALSTVTSTTAAVVATDSAQAAILDCLKKCDNDVDCNAHCVVVPSPDASAVNKTTECSAACPQGNGTQAETEAYAQCLQDCVEQYYYTSSVGTPTDTGAAGSGNSGSVSASVTSIVSTVTSGSSTFTTTFASTATHSSATGSAASTSSSGSPGDIVRPGSSVVGLLGAIAAVLAL